MYVYRAHGVAAVIIRGIEDGIQESTSYMSKQIIALMITETEIFFVKEYLLFSLVTCLG
ncbi:hypothetical protein WAX74_11615 [Psychrobacillus sp. FJAT-51614]|uniref:Uncharacterized protein n=1 Tax=Psychrobacillus mangrovi TaxID=3117745 RepID=A0ABU8F5J0_9BACI